MKNFRKHKAFSLVELLVSMAIIGVLIVMLSNILTTSIFASRKIAARSFVREEIAIASDRLVSDVRAAFFISSCSGLDANATCSVTLDSGIFTWKLCDTGQGLTSLCRFDAAGNRDYATSQSLTVNKFQIEESIGSSDESGQGLILITLVASHRNLDLNVVNVIRQISSSTRNYLLTEINDVPVGTPRDPLTTGTTNCSATAGITFENLAQTAEGTLITNQYLASHGVTFNSPGTNTVAGNTITCSAVAPSLAKKGIPLHAFTTSLYGGDGINPLDSTKVGNVFLTDVPDQNATVFCQLRVAYQNPTTELSFDLLDVDYSETYSIRFFDSNAAEITGMRRTVSAIPGDQSNDGRATRVSVGGATAPVQSFRVIGTSSNQPSGGWGLGFDNFWPTCANPEASPTR